MRTYSRVLDIDVELQEQVREDGTVSRECCASFTRVCNHCGSFHGVDHGIAPERIDRVVSLLSAASGIIPEKEEWSNGHGFTSLNWHFDLGWKEYPGF